MKPENKSDLHKYYKYIYTCQCGNTYGSDEEEKGKLICPECQDKNKLQ